MGALWVTISTFFGGLSSTTYIVMAVVALLAIGGLWFHHNQATLVKDAATNATLQINDDAQKQALAQAAIDQEAAQALGNDLTTAQLNDANQTTHLAVALTKLDKDAILNPPLVEQKINAASDARNRCFALVTGAVAMKGETNVVCPQVLK
jgi:hypothetical protein